MSEGRFDSARMVAALRRLVEAESPSSDTQALARCRRVIEDLFREIVGSAPEHVDDALLWRRGGGSGVLLLGHYDTIWPTGTLDTFPYTVEERIARGPGVFDMKAGLVQGLLALRASTGPAAFLVTADEETGSARSDAMIEREARRSSAVLVLEPAAEGGRVKVARKGIGDWQVRVRGTAAHPGLDPEKGINAALELARQIEVISGLGRADAGTTVTVTMLGGGTAPNVVPETAWCVVDGRAWSREEGDRLEREMSALEPVLNGARVEVEGGMRRVAMPRSASEDLYARLAKLGYEVGAAEVGGASDGNLTAALGIPTLDGLGAVGGGAHARDEHVIVDEMPRRAEMVARLIDDLAGDG